MVYLQDEIGYLDLQQVIHKKLKCKIECNHRLVIIKMNFKYKIKYITDAIINTFYRISHTQINSEQPREISYALTL